MNLRMTFWRTRCGMNVVSTKIPTKIKCIFDGEIREILVTECYNFVFCNKEGQLVFAGIV